MSEETKKPDKFNDVNEAAARLSKGTYTGTVVPTDISEGESLESYSNTAEAASKLSRGTYTGTVVPSNKEAREK